MCSSVCVLTSLTLCCKCDGKMRNLRNPRSFLHLCMSHINLTHNFTGGNVENQQR